jgi:translation initiation factor 3 subunit B
VILWGGPKWSKCQKFHHPGVKLIDFSPCEKYVATYSQLAEQESKDQAIIIWDVITGQKMRAFANLNPAWPAFKWSHDDQYFARVNEEGALSVYETNTFSLINKKSYKLDAAIHDFAWSPSDAVISAWVAEYNNVPARVFLLQVPGLTVLSQKNLYNVIDVRARSLLAARTNACCRPRCTGRVPATTCASKSIVTAARTRPRPLSPTSSCSACARRVCRLKS